MNRAQPSDVPLRARLEVGLLDARKRRDASAVAALRSTLAAIDNAGAVEVQVSRDPIVGRPAEAPRRLLTEDDHGRILEDHAVELRWAITESEGAGRPERVDDLRRQLETLSRFLPD